MRASYLTLWWNKAIGWITRASAKLPSGLAAQAERLATLWGTPLEWSPWSKIPPSWTTPAALFSLERLPIGYNSYHLIRHLLIAFKSRVMNGNGNWERSSFRSLMSLLGAVVFLYDLYMIFFLVFWVLR